MEISILISGGLFLGGGEGGVGGGAPDRRGRVDVLLEDD
jgi:hypothetical protein